MGERQTPRAGTESSGWVIYPFLAAIFPIVSVLSSNAPDVPLSDVVLPILGMLGLSAVLWFALFFVLRDRFKRGLLVLGILVLFWSYGAVLDGIRAAFHYRETLSSLQILPLVAVEFGLVLMLLVVLRRTRRSLGGLTRFLNVTSGIGVALAVGISANEYIGPPATSAFSSDPPPATSAFDGEARDIVYIVADAYGRHDLIRDRYGYDNTVFVEELESRGFYVARKSRANYNFTRFSIASSLNFDYVNDVAEELGGDRPTAQLIRNSRLRERLERRGYEIVSFATGFSATEMHGADRYLKPRILITEFQQVLVDATPLRSLMNRMRAHLATRNGPRSGVHDLHRERVLFALKSLQHMKWSDGPEFVFAHIVSPHGPFVLDENSNPVYPEIRYNLAADFHEWEFPSPEEFIEGYRKQVQGLNPLLLEAIDGIRRDNPDAIIVLQGDHGPRQRTDASGQVPWQTFIADDLPILNAYFLPGIDAEKVLYPRISPVNTFRVILNSYFQEDLPLLEDRSYMWVKSPKELHAVPPSLMEDTPPRRESTGSMPGGV